MVPSLVSRIRETCVQSTSMLPLQLEIKSIIEKLLTYCQQNNWAGYDPYDALNSQIFNYVPVLDFKFARLAVTQLLKRSPINIRSLALIPKTQNPKALALFIMAFIKLSRLGMHESREFVSTMVDKLIQLRSKGTPYWCWGYSFPWQTRTMLVPRGAPNLVCTVFVAEAFLDFHAYCPEPQYLHIAASAADYLINELYRQEDGVAASFSYPLPSSRSQVHNANLLGAAFLCRVYKHTGDRGLVDAAFKVARYSVGKQHDDGSWDYGEAPKQHWIDNFHTGYNLCALRSIGQGIGTSEFEPSLQKGFKFYRNHFFRDDGAPKYFHNRVYPIDIHSVAQSIITLLTFRDLDEDAERVALAVFRWSMQNLWDSQGYCYYRKHLLFTDRTSYMRWSQAWMLLAMATMLEQYNNSMHSVQKTSEGSLESSHEALE